MEEYKELKIKAGYKWYFHDLVIRYNTEMKEKYKKNSQDMQDMEEEAKVDIPESERIYLAPPKHFMPTWKADSTAWIKKNCDKVSKTTYIQGNKYLHKCS